jgi:hypothetical protein
LAYFFFADFLAAVFFFAAFFLGAITFFTSFRSVSLGLRFHAQHVVA